MNKKFTKLCLMSLLSGPFDGLNQMIFLNFVQKRIARSCHKSATKQNWQTSFYQATFSRPHLLSLRLGLIKEYEMKRFDFYVHALPSSLTSSTLKIKNKNVLWTFIEAKQTCDILPGILQQRNKVFSWNSQWLKNFIKKWFDRRMKGGRPTSPWSLKHSNRFK